MPNTIETAAIFQEELDKAAIQVATSGWMEPNADKIKYNGGAEVKIPILSTDGLADYEDGFVDGSLSFKYVTKKMTMDRGRRFTFDEHKTDETGFLLTASMVMGEFQRTHVIPELDAYRYSAIAKGAINKNQARGGYTPTADNVLSNLYDDIANIQDVVGEDIPLIITISTKVASLFDRSKELNRNLSVIDFEKGDISTKVRSLDGEHPLIRVGSARMKTEYIFNDGKTSNQESGGFKPASSAKNINWIICPKNVPIAVSKTDNIRIFDPETYQAKRSWAMDYRKFHDIWIPDNKWDCIFVNVKEAL